MMQIQSHKQLSTANTSLYSGKNKRHYILQYSAKILVAAAEFEPTTFGLWEAIGVYRPMPHSTIYRVKQAFFIFAHEE